MKILITGGCKNGKSTYAQNIITSISEKDDKYYIATMKPTDDEDILRIKRHKEERLGCNFKTIEKETNIASIVALLKKDSSILLDSTTALLANEMFLENGDYIIDAYKKVSIDILQLSKSVKNIVVVSDGIFSDITKYESMTENYRYGLAFIDKALSKEFDTVIEMCFSTPTFLKGELNI